MFSLQPYFLDGPTSPFPPFLFYANFYQDVKYINRKRAQMLTDQMHKSSQREHTWVSSTQIQKENLTLKVLLVPLSGPLFHPGVTTVPLFSAPHTVPAFGMICVHGSTQSSPGLASSSCRDASLCLVSHLSLRIRNIPQLYTRPFFLHPIDGDLNYS